MPSAAPRAGLRTPLLILVVVAAAIVAARLPFLLHGSRFFDSDEAVEGLMARHVLTGEFPLFLWGQRYKGVPEVYLAAAAFRVWPAGVIALKAVTLACYVAYGCLNFHLVAGLFSRRVAWIATAFLIAGPPSLVLWTLSGSAEIVMTFLAGTSLLLGVSAWKRSGSRTGLVAAAAALGFGLWIQQYIVFYAAAAAVAVVDWSPAGRARLRELAGGAWRPTWLRGALRLLTLAAGLYVVLGLAAFLGLGFAVSPFGVAVSVADPQKMWWIAAGLLLIWAAALTAARLIHTKTWPMWLAPALAFLVAYAPAIAGRFLSEGPGAPRARLDLAGLGAVLPEFSGVALPILFGFSSPTTERLPVPAWSALVIITIGVISYVRVMRLKGDEHNPLISVFHIFVVVAPILFVASGSYIDAQSYRYLMPVHAALPVVYAVGIEAALRTNRMAGVALLAALVSLFAWQQAEWYRRLEPDREALAIVNCLNKSGIRAARADYWLSYKLTFLTGERVIVAPTNGTDRYPPYTATVRAEPSAATIERLPPASVVDMPCEALVH
jgi:hypothetical protein